MKLPLSLVIILFFLSCSNSPEKPISEQPALDSFPLPDSLFAFENISSSLLSEHFYFDENNNGYTDSSKKIKLTPLTPAQKKHLINPISPYSKDWIMQDWIMHFVSKQRKIGAFTPIIISAGGTDFSALIMVVLDSTCHPVSSFILSGGECGNDPIECDLKNSFFSENQIRSYVRTIVNKENMYSSDTLLLDYLTQLITLLKSWKTAPFKPGKVTAFAINEDLSLNNTAANGALPKCR